MEGGGAMEGREQWEGERWRVGGWMDLTHLGSLSPMSVHECWLLFMGSHLCSWVGVMSWSLVICGWGSSSSVLSFVVAVAVLGAGLSFVGAALLFMGGGLTHGQCMWFVGLMFVGCGCHTRVGWGQLWVIDERGGHCFVVLLWLCVVLSSCCTVRMVAMLPCWRHGPCIQV